MPLYLVRGPDACAYLIRARDLDHLSYLIDEFDDPAGYVADVYDGPVCVELSLPASVEVEGDPTDASARITTQYLGDPRGEAICATPALAPAGDHGEQMLDHLRQLAFPTFALAVESALDRDHLEDVVADPCVLGDAIVNDVEPRIRRAVWLRRGALSRGDAESAVALMAGISIPLDGVVRGGETHGAWAAAGWTSLEELDDELEFDDECELGDGDD